MPDLFEQSAREYYRRHAPLAERMRPATLDAFFGQRELVGPGRYLRRMLESDQLRSIILWGPPGTGKTTLARIVAGVSGRRFVAVSAVSSGVAEVKRILAEAEARLAGAPSCGTILFIDEIHRFNKAQQDALLRGVEQGTVTLVGATTENPSFTVNGALLSRAQVLVLEPLEPDALRGILRRALADETAGLGERGLQLSTGGESALVDLAAGDGRAALNFLELAALLAGSRGVRELDERIVAEAAGRRALLYDRGGEEHYNVVSALIKSMRGSDPDAALYYLARMLDGGEDPEFVARRLLIFASEDVGNADPQALGLAVACKDAVRFVGLPEALFALSQCTVYLAAAPKSNAAGLAYARAVERVRQHGALAVPLHLRNAPTALAREQGCAAGYRSPHDHADAWVDERYLPEQLGDARFYEPSDRGFERRIGRRLARLRARRDEA